MDRPGSAPCSRCGGSGVVIAPQGGQAAAAVCECSLRCRLCNNTRYLFERDREGRDVARMCACEVRRVRVRLFNEAGIPAKFFDATFESARQDPYNESAIYQLRQQAKDYQQGRNTTLQKGTLLMGGPGTGKTYLLCAYLRELILVRGVPAQFRDFFHLLADLRSGYSQDRPESELIGPLVDVEVLAIDELGKGRNTPWEQNILDVIISNRYNNNKTTLFTTNYTDKSSTTLAERLRSKDNPTSDPEVLRDTLVERVGPRIYSRLREMCFFAHLTGDDRREYVGGEDAP